MSPLRQASAGSIRSPCAAEQPHPLEKQIMNSVVHFEMPYGNPARMAKFYEQAFGWHTKPLGEDMGNYVLATTAESDAQGGPKEAGRINGGFYPKKSESPAQYPTVVIAVDNVEKAAEEVRKAGGKVLGEPMEIPGVGQYVSFTDTEGNRVSMLQPSHRNGKGHAAKKS
jgi:predicted enzyme related to lactoylglutathione lyase